MDILLSILAFVLATVGIIGCIIPALPGVVLSFGGLLCAYFASYSQMGYVALAWWAVAVVVVSAADYLLPAWMTRRFGGTRSGAIGATLGVFVGFFFPFPIVGLILGPFAGAVLGELLHDKQDVDKAFRSGFGSFLAFLVGTGAKLIVAISIFIHIATDTYPVVRDWVVGLF